MKETQSSYKSKKEIYFWVVVFIIFIAFLIFSSNANRIGQNTFNAERAFKDLSYQLTLGPRTPGTAGHAAVISWVSSELPKYGWQVEIQKGSIGDQKVENIIAKKGTGSRWIIIGAHYDTRQFADQDPDVARQTQPVPGASDGASGVAVLMELARVLPVQKDTEIWLVFFDTEDQGRIDQKDWIVGSRYFASQLTRLPSAVVILDMIGDKNLEVFQEMNSDKNLTNEIWNIAASLGYKDHFNSATKHSMLDDHTPFIEKGIPAVDIIDFDYPYWHTTSDNMENVSAESLKVIGDTILEWIITKPF